MIFDSPRTCRQTKPVVGVLQSFSLLARARVRHRDSTSTAAQLYLSDPFGFSSVSLNRPSQPVSMTLELSQMRSQVTQVKDHGPNHISWNIMASELSEDRIRSYTTRNLNATYAKHALNMPNIRRFGFAEGALQC